MPSVKVSLEYLQKLPLYKYEKPYWCFLEPREGFDPDIRRVDNLEFEEYSGIEVRDIRDLPLPPLIEDSGFEVLNHESKFSHFHDANQLEQYRVETEELLKERLQAIYVKCYDHRLRKNAPQERKEINLLDPLVVEGPARGVHNGRFYHRCFLNRKLISD